MVATRYHDFLVRIEDAEAGACLIAAAGQGPLTGSASMIGTEGLKLVVHPEQESKHHNR